MFEVIYDRIKHGTISVFPMIRGEISESVYIDKLQETFPSLSDNDCSEILQQHACKIEEIIFVYQDFETAVKALAEVGGYVDDNNKKYFDFRAFGKDLRTSRNCIDLTSGRILFNIIFPPSWDTEERREHAVLKSRRFYTNRPSEQQYLTILTCIQIRGLIWSLILFGGIFSYTNNIRSNNQEGRSKKGSEIHFVFQKNYKRSQNIWKRPIIQLMTNPILQSET